jgi:hypothetical protein
MDGKRGCDFGDGDLVTATTTTGEQCAVYGAPGTREQPRAPLPTGRGRARGLHRMRAGVRWCCDFNNIVRANPAVRRVYCLQ